VAARVGGRILHTTHTGDATTTAQALQAQFPAHWTATRLANVWTITGPDVLAAVAYEGSTLTTTPTGDPYRGEVMRRTTTIQLTIWTQLDTSGRPTRWDPTGCDTYALKAQTALRQILPDPYRVYIRPQQQIRAFDESFGDGREYMGASFDSDVTWVDFDALRYYGFGGTSAAVGPLEAVDGTIESSDGVTVDTTTFDVDSTP
jgi:hypothetical protein